MFALLQLAYVHGLLRNHEDALECYKQVLYYSWYYSRFKVEMKACQGIAMQYFYLGQLQKAKHYHTRSIRGKSENDSSIVKRSAISVIQQQIESEFKLKITFESVPSPSGFCTETGNNN
jgi:tetratricopeptide (TPR) repeat protein